ncbi:hypothetical protein PanWU01x14_335630 [Parasponia andersonii]|uniref:Uncharacterized protein n=1 Tax=Parasponia andersonii TaxID=3476 RepID=A0A2P5AG65_PARAD|nr:hypothetical protein PanWU01x14_335630 [Parasponia andersonii]
MIRMRGSQISGSRSLRRHSIPWENDRNTIGLFHKRCSCLGALGSRLISLMSQRYLVGLKVTDEFGSFGEDDLNSTGQSSMREVRA